MNPIRRKVRDVYKRQALVIAADSTFSNEGNLGADSGTTGDITVAGTLTNVLKAASGTDAGITGKINANAVNVEEGGVVNAALDDNYKVTTTNVAGTFATTLNAKTLASNKTNDALELKSAFVVLSLIHILINLLLEGQIGY